MEAHRFEPLGHDLTGYWTVSSSIDWCERNYVVSWFIAEFWNTISAAIIFMCGAIDLHHAIKMKAEMRFIIYSLSVMMVGIGTATFHGTLTFIGQLGDELPMVWCMMVLWYIMIVMDKKVVTSTLLPKALLCYSTIFSVVHAVGAFHRLFQVHFVALILVTLLFAYKHLGTYGKHPSLWPLGYCYVAVWGVACIVWLMDQFACERLHSLQIGSMDVPNPQFHAVWHILTGYCTHVGMIFVRVMRYMALYDQQPKVSWFMGFWPTINDLPPKSLPPAGVSELDIAAELPTMKSKTS